MRPGRWSVPDLFVTRVPEGVGQFSAHLSESRKNDFENLTNAHGNHESENIVKIHVPFAKRYFLNTFQLFSGFPCALVSSRVRWSASDVTNRALVSSREHWSAVTSDKGALVSSRGHWSGSE